MTLQQLFQLALTVLFVFVLIELAVALTLFHVRMWKEDRQRKATRHQHAQQGSALDPERGEKEKP